MWERLTNYELRTNHAVSARAVSGYWVAAALILISAWMRETNHAMFGAMYAASFFLCARTLGSELQAGRDPRYRALLLVVFGAIAQVGLARELTPAINPLVTLGFGALLHGLLSQKLRPVRWIALIVGVALSLVMTPVIYGVWLPTLHASAGALPERRSIIGELLLLLIVCVLSQSHYAWVGAVGAAAVYALIQRLPFEFSQHFAGLGALLALCYFAFPVLHALR